MIFWKKYIIKRKERKSFSTCQKRVVEFVKLANLLKEAKRFEEALKSLQLAIELLDYMMNYLTNKASTRATLKRKNISLIIQAKFLAETIERHYKKKKEEDLQFFIHDLDRDYMNSVPANLTPISPYEKMKLDILQLSLQEGKLSQKALKCIDEMCGNNHFIKYIK